MEGLKDHIHNNRIHGSIPGFEVTPTITNDVYKAFLVLVSTSTESLYVKMDGLRNNMAKDALMIACGNVTIDVVNPGNSMLVWIARCLINGMIKCNVMVSGNELQKDSALRISTMAAIDNTKRSESSLRREEDDITTCPECEKEMRYSDPHYYHYFDKFERTSHVKYKCTGKIYNGPSGVVKDKNTEETMAERGKRLMRKRDEAIKKNRERLMKATEAAERAAGRKRYTAYLNTLPKQQRKLIRERDRLIRKKEELEEKKWREEYNLKRKRPVRRKRRKLNYEEKNIEYQENDPLFHTENNTDDLEKEEGEQRGTGIDDCFPSGATGDAACLIDSGGADLSGGSDCISSEEISDGEECTDDEEGSDAE